MEPKAVTLTDVRNYFGYESAAQFRQEWSALPEQDKAQIKQGLSDGTLNY